ncbi:dihydrolipoamide acetyltransferase family protein [Desulfopila inferna]|uniref:dihydrolipoamide acetyltransferase family protein n=1 Tax=Desulfopila inferna TaxID=468528 RepID=UPI0019654CB6|nr:dihydrolipoamide acetyltransferase family protein [Desulfopila inferna]MBM9605288.1 2-oxo acid dehydrogenase subunit E2 [Desulfopila inferna]
MAEFRMPSLGSDMQAGTLIEWLVKPGDSVRRRDVVAVVDTEKAAIEIEVYEDGFIESLLVEPGQKVPVGTVMAVIKTEEAEESKEPPKKTPAQETPPPSPKPEGESEPLPEPENEPFQPSFRTSAPERLKVSPYARKLAAGRGVDLSTLKGTGPEGAIRASDIEQAAAAPPIPPQPTTPFPEKAGAGDHQTSMRRAIANAMARSKREIPHYYLQTRIDMSRTLLRLTSENEKRPIKDRILPVVPLIRAVALALTDFPEFNGYWIDDRHQTAEAINIGFVISLRRGGIVAPAILNADEMTGDELMAALRDLIRRARSGGLRSSEVTDATITVTSLGELGVETVYGIIYPPQLALVGFGKTMEQPWAENGMLGVRPVLTATLAADHRATDGHRGAKFLDAINRYLQETPEL